MVHRDAKVTFRFFDSDARLTQIRRPTVGTVWRECGSE